MKRGFPGPPDPHLAPRKPLQSDGLDRSVIRGMEGFGFGTEEEIEKKLLEVLGSDAYRCAIDHWEGKQAINLRDDVIDDKYWGSLSNVSLGDKFDEIDSIMPAYKKSNCFSGFGLWGRKRLSSAFSSSLTLMLRSPPESQLPPSSGDGREMGDPTYGFHPLVSIYFLAQEKAERERTRDPGNVSFQLE